MNSFSKSAGSGGSRGVHWGMVRFAVVFYAVMALLSLAWAGLLEHRWVWNMPGGLVRPGSGLFGCHAWCGSVLWLVLGFLFGAAVAGLSRLASGRVGWLDAMEEGFCDLLGPIGWGQALVMAAASAVGEEFLFRGIALPALGLWWSSLLFGLVHFPMDRRFLAWPLFAALVGLVFGALTLGSGNLGSSILAHFTINFLNLMVIGRKAASRPPVVTARVIGPMEGEGETRGAPGQGDPLESLGDAETRDADGHADGEAAGDVSEEQ